MAVYYSSQGPFYGVPFKVTFDLRSADGTLVALAGADSEIRKDDGSFADCTNEASGITTGFAELELTAAEMTCNSFIVQVKGDNHVTNVYHGVPSHDVAFIGTISAYSAGTPSLTLNTTDQVGSSTNGFYDGCWIVPIEGTGAGQSGRFASTEVTYNGTSKLVTLSAPFSIALSTDTVVMIYRAHISTGIVDVNVVEINGNTLAAESAESYFVGDIEFAPSTSDIVDAIDSSSTQLAAILEDTGTTLPAAISTIDNNVDAILVDTGTTLDGKLDAIDNFVDTEVAAIKAKTDQLTFGVTGTVNANITHVNEVEVGGDGEEGTEWGPAA